MNNFLVVCCKCTEVLDLERDSEMISDFPPPDTTYSVEITCPKCKNKQIIQ